MRFYWLALGILCVWRMTHLCVAEDGPWDLMVRLRNALRPGFWQKVLTCFYCLSLWVALPLALWIGESWVERVLLWPALSAGAILLERATATGPAIYHEEPEDSAARSRDAAPPTEDPSPPAGG